VAAMSIYRRQKKWALFAAFSGLVLAMVGMSAVMLRIPTISTIAPFFAAPGLLMGIIGACAWGAISFHEALELQRRQGSVGLSTQPETRISVTSDRAPAPVGAYPHARRCNDFLFLSGVGPRQPGSNEIPGNVLDAQGNLLSYDIEAQCRSVFDNVRSILAASGAHWEQLIDVTVYLTDMPRDFGTYNRLYGEYFVNAQPCRTTVGITALPTPIAIELKCVAWLGDAQP